MKQKSTARFLMVRCGISEEVIMNPLRITLAVLTILASVTTMPR